VPAGVREDVARTRWPWRRIELQIVPSANVRAALAAVEAATPTPASYRTDARGDAKVTVA
jgi:hypothetical protein